MKSKYILKSEPVKETYKYTCKYGWAKIYDSFYVAFGNVIQAKYFLITSEKKKFSDTLLN